MTTIIEQSIERIFSRSKKLKQKFKPFISRLPYMYGLIKKTHKPDNPVRPIISSIGSCSYELSKWLAQQLSPYIGTISNSHIINSLDLISKLST